MPNARILVVDDEPAVVRLTSQILELRGYEVLSATNPREALKAAGEGRPVDLILSDVLMPEINGVELVRRFREQSPSTAAMFMSGYAAGNLPADVPIVKKPFTPEGLVAAVEQALRDATQAQAAGGPAREMNGKLPADMTRIPDEMSRLIRGREQTLPRPAKATGHTRPRGRGKHGGPGTDRPS